MTILQLVGSVMALWFAASIFSAGVWWSLRRDRSDGRGPIWGGPE